MKKQIFWLVALFGLLFSLTSFTTSTYSGDKNVTYKQVKGKQISPKTFKTLSRVPKFNRALSFRSGNRIAVKKGFKLFNHGNISILVKDEENDMGPKILGYEVDIVGTFGDIIIVAICECSEGSDDCQFEQNQHGDTICIGSACSDCRGGFEIWGPAGEIEDTITPF